MFNFWKLWSLAAAIIWLCWLYRGAWHSRGRAGECLARWSAWSGSPCLLILVVHQWVGKRCNLFTLDCLMYALKRSLVPWLGNWKRLERFLHFILGPFLLLWVQKRTCARLRQGSLKSWRSAEGRYSSGVPGVCLTDWHLRAVVVPAAWSVQNLGSVVRQKWSGLQLWPAQAGADLSRELCPCFAAREGLGAWGRGPVPCHSAVCWCPSELGRGLIAVPLAQGTVCSERPGRWRGGSSLSAEQRGTRVHAGRQVCLLAVCTNSLVSCRARLVFIELEQIRHIESIWWFLVKCSVFRGGKKEVFPSMQALYKFCAIEFINMFVG